MKKFIRFDQKSNFDIQFPLLPPPQGTATFPGGKCRLLVCPVVVWKIFLSSCCLVPEEVYGVNIYASLKQNELYYIIWTTSEIPWNFVEHLNIHKGAKSVTSNVRTLRKTNRKYKLNVIHAKYLKCYFCPKHPILHPYMRKMPSRSMYELVHIIQIWI